MTSSTPLSPLQIYLVDKPPDEYDPMSYYSHTKPTDKNEPGNMKIKGEKFSVTLFCIGHFLPKR